MLTRRTVVREPLDVSGDLHINDSVAADTIARRDSFLHVWGDLRGNLTIEPDAHVIIEGCISGHVTSSRGRLAVHGRRIADFATTAPPELAAGGVLKINLSAIASNWCALAKCTLAECAAVVKADAYGCGIEPVATALAQSGCKTFFVSSLAEAKRVRAAAPTSTIYVLDGLFPGTGPLFAQIGARPVISALAELVEWDAFSSSSGWSGGFALYVDVGTGRRGLSIDEAVAFAERIGSKHQAPALLMSGLDDEEGSHHLNQDRQIEAFRELSHLYPSVPASLANSYGIFCGPKTHFDLVRPGSALYGINPIPGGRNPMLPVVEVKGRVTQVRDMDPGETIAAIGWTAERRSRIALVSVGHADGFPEAAASASKTPLRAIFGQQVCPIVGRVATDRLAVDMTALSAPAMAGELITLIGRRIGIDDIAAAANATGYQVLTRLGRRFHRIYRADTRIRDQRSVNQETHMLDKLKGQDERKGSASFAANVAGTVQQLHSSTPAQQAAVSASSGTLTSINADTTITGKIRSSSAVTVSGRIEGELNAETAVICEGAEVDGTIITRELTVGGRVKGAIRAMRVHLLSTAVVEADIFHRTLSIDENAVFEGTSKRQENPTEVSHPQVDSPALQSSSRSSAHIDGVEAPQAGAQTIN